MANMTTRAERIYSQIDPIRANAEQFGTVTTVISLDQGMILKMYLPWAVSRLLPGT